MKLYKILITASLLLQYLNAIDEIDATLNKVVTSATGFDTQLKDEARNMFVIDKKTIEDKGYQSIEQALTYIPIVTFSGSAFGNEIDMRSQGGDAKTAVKVLINRVPINAMNTHGFTAFNSINIEDIESIEVLPGGGAVVYGNGTRGGVINIVTKRNPRDYASMTLKGGSYEASQTGFTQYNLSGGKRITEKFFLKANASIQTQLGYRKQQDLTNWFGDIEALYDFNENHSLDFNATYSYSKSLTSSNLTYKQLKADRRSAGRTTTDRNLDFFMTSLHYKGKIGNNLEFDGLGYYQFTQNYYKNITKTPAKDIIGNPTLFYSEQGGINLKGKYSITKNILMFGVDSIYGGSIIGSKSPPRGSTSSDTLYTGDSRWANSIYILDQIKPLNYFDITAGARYENSYYNIYKKAKGQSKNLYFQTRFINSYALELTPNFKYSDTGNVYAKYERGFIAPLAFYLLRSDESGTNINKKLLPSTYNTYELGWKDEFSWTFLSLTAYYTDTQNEFLLNMIDKSRFYYTYENIGRTSRMGIELAGMQEFFDVFSIAESISYVDTKITKTVTSNAKNKRVPYTNEYKMTLNFNYDFYKKDKTLASIFLNNSFLGPRLDNNFAKMDAYILGDLGIKFLKDGFTFNLGARNIYNALYIDYQSYASYSQTTGYIPAPGRSYYAELRYSF
ncbi:TonB-dependent receptor [Helicobacter sp. 11S03491-1]|uniref:TonB-dependent receptor n=1 Tax=Helicobacter sp. 11S03491-1 TaxID=1476196 RepID=UPI000BA65AE8|nr:TonB-dependent receptor [Helicobacter sp. 11S03491-1]PAF43297.1 hypothetical protein BKH45_01265 [Helicobacter sp. 11S03491-1]